MIRMNISNVAVKKLYDIRYMVSIEGGNSLVLKGFSERSFEKVLTVLQSANLRGRAAANVKRGE